MTTTYQTTVTIGSATPENVERLAAYVGTFIPAFTIREGLGYWQSESEPSVDFIHIGNDAESYEFVWALTHWALGHEPDSTMSDDCILVVRHKLTSSVLIYADRQEEV